MRTLCMLFFLPLLYYFCEDSKVLNYYTTLSVKITNGACWSFCLLPKCPEKPVSVLLENRTAPQRILWLQSLHVSNMGESAWKVRSIHWFAGSVGETLYIWTSISARKRYPTVLALSPHTCFHYSRINFEEKEWIILAFCHSKYVKQT